MNGIKFNLIFHRLVLVAESFFNEIKDMERHKTSEAGGENEASGCGADFHLKIFIARYPDSKKDTC